MKGQTLNNKIFPPGGHKSIKFDLKVGMRGGFVYPALAELM